MTVGRRFSRQSAEHVWHSKAGIVAAKTLFNAGADVHSRTRDGKTVLHEAVLNKREVAELEVATVMLLLEWGVDAGIRDARGETALDLAKNMGDTEVVRILRDVESKDNG